MFCGTMPTVPKPNWTSSMNAEHRPNQMTQQAIREVVQVIRQWYLTICHDLCIRPPVIRIRKPVHVSMYNMTPIGWYDAQTNTVTIFVCGESMREEYLLTLAHELKHAWQHHFHVPRTEREAEEYEAYFIKRFSSGPNAGEYLGPIDGLSMVVKCRECGQTMDAAKGSICGRCLRRRRQAQEIIQRCRDCGRLLETGAGDVCQRCLCTERSGGGGFDSDEYERTTGPASPHVRPKQSAEQTLVSRLKKAYLDRKRNREAHQAAERHSYTITQIDNHPSNGQQGWWAIDETYYVFASTAGEAIIKVGDWPLERCPCVVFLGLELPEHIRPKKGAGANAIRLRNHLKS